MNELKATVLVKVVKVIEPNNKMSFDINRNDLYSLEHALSVKDKRHNFLSVMSMGSKETIGFLQRMYNYGVDESIVLEDACFAGADTAATARVLAAAIKKSNIDLVFLGKESTDSSTAQVPAQIADYLGYNLVYNVSAVELDEENCAICTFEKENEVICAKYSLPLIVVSSINCNHLRVPKIKNYLEAKDKVVKVFGREDLGVDGELCGNKGSFTKVVRVDDVIKDSNCEEITGDYEEFILEKINESKCIKSQTCTKDKHGVCKEDFDKKVVVIGDFIDNYTFEAFRRMVAGIVKLAGERNVSVLLFGEDSKYAGELSTIGVDRIYVSDISKNGLDYLYMGKRVASVIKKIVATEVLYACTYLMRIIAPIVAAELEVGLTADCTSIYYEKNILNVVRPTFGESKMATIQCCKNYPHMATLRIGCFGEEVSSNEEAIVQHVASDVKEENNSGIAIIRTDSIEQLSWDKKVIMIAGAGLKSESISLLERIAGALNCDFGVTRPVVDKGIKSYNYQVGQTGRNVIHDLYISFGVSGALEHVVGIGKRTKVIAVNTDSNCEMKKWSHYFINADANEIINLLAGRIL